MRNGSLNLNNEALVQAYVSHYDGSGQVGNGMLPAFQGSMYQDGAGLGDILRSFFRHVIPIVAPGAASFLSSAVQGLNDGQTFKQAALSGLAPAAKTMVSSAAKGFFQPGSGSRRRKRRAAATGGGTKAKRARRKRRKGGRKKHVYKRANKRAIKKSSNRGRIKSTSIPLIPTNF